MVRGVFGVEIDFDVHDVGFGGSEPIGNGASASLFAFSASVPGFVISAYYRLSDVFGESLTTIFID